MKPMARPALDAHVGCEDVVNVAPRGSKECGRWIDRQLVDHGETLDKVLIVMATGECIRVAYLCVRLAYIDSRSMRLGEQARH